MATEITEIKLEGYVRNASGHFVPEDEVSEHEKLRDATVRMLAERAELLHAQLAEFKKKALADIADLVSIAAEKYDVKLGGEKGNVTLVSYDGEYKIIRAYAEIIQFSEEVSAAKALIEQCMESWGEGSNNHLRVIADRAFRTNQNGELKTSRVMDLMAAPIDDPDWQRGMKALRDAIQVTGTAVYVRFYKRMGNSDKYQALPLDLASV